MGLQVHAAAPGFYVDAEDVNMNPSGLGDKPFISEPSPQSLGYCFTSDQ